MKIKENKKLVKLGKEMAKTRLYKIAIPSIKKRKKKSIADTFIDLIENKLSSVKIYNHVKRMDTPAGRDFVVRVCWEVHKGEKRLESDWEGFETTEQAIKDLIKKCK